MNEFLKETFEIVLQKYKPTNTIRLQLENITLLPEGNEPPGTKNILFNVMN